MTVKVFPFNPFQENTYVVYDETKECIIFDPGCNMSGEKRLLADFIKKNELKPVKLINTHCHLDHVFGNAFVKETYNIPFEIHEGELPVLQSYMPTAQMYNVPCEASPEPDAFINDGDEIRFGNSALKAILTPGHSPASLSFFSESDRFVIAGDVLFYHSIGRTDLPGGDYKTLINSIINKLLPLGDDVVVYNGHGQSTTIGRERLHNPFLQG
jgi:glyoxylase-like metal-dependent hydrolase (beta-lactamase superfamily II)